MIRSYVDLFDYFHQYYGNIQSHILKYKSILLATDIQASYRTYALKTKYIQDFFFKRNEYMKKR